VSTPSTAPPSKSRTVRVVLSAAAAEALARRASRNDRYEWHEAQRIIREALERDGDLGAEPNR